MPLWLSTVLEIIKVTVPALIVFFTVYYLFKQYLNQQLQVKAMDFKHSQQSTTIPMRLQAYERLSLFLERIAIPGMMLRVQQENMTAKQMALALMISVQKEYEHNITQQVYVGNQLWRIINFAKEDVLGMIQLVSENMAPEATAKDFGNAIIAELKGREMQPLEKALEAIKKEASVILK